MNRFFVPSYFEIVSLHNINYRTFVKRKILSNVHYYRCLKKQ